MHHAIPAYPPAARVRSAGSVLILVILAIVFLTALAAGVVTFLGTSNLDNAASNLAEKVYYNAESGFRFLSQQYKSKGDANGNGFADDDKAAVLIALNGATVQLPGNLGSFTLDIRPYWFISSQDYTTTNSITVRVPGSLPDGYTLPASGVLEVENNSLHAYTSADASNPPFVTFTLATQVTNLKSGKSVYMTLPPTSSQSVAKGGSLTLSTTSGSVFPDRNGQIEVNDVAATYRTATFNSGTNVLTLTGLSSALDVSSGDRVILKKSAWVTSSGQAGSGGFASTNDVQYNITLADDSTGDGSDIAYAEEGRTYDLDGTSPFTPGEGGGWGSGGYIDGSGSTQGYVTTDDIQSTRDPESACTHYIRFANNLLSMNSLFAGYWTNATSHLLSYDVQAKISWGVYLTYAAGGLSFRLHQSATPGKYNYLGLSFMRYGSPNSCSRNLDYIPDSIKPIRSSGSGGGGGWGGWGGSRSLAGHCLLVLWEQEVVNGAEHRKWIAYKDLNNENCVKGNQWSGDGQCVTDNSVMMLRSLERLVNGSKTSDIAIYFGDASYHNCPAYSRRPDAIPNNDELYRNAYYLNSTYPVASTPFPTFAPLKASKWNSSVDYYTFLETDGGATTPCTWDAINSAATGYTLLDDGGTLRTAKFVTRDDYYPSDRYELGLHQFNGGDDNYVITYRDYSFQFLIPTAATTGSVSSAVQR